MVMRNGDQIVTARHEGAQFQLRDKDGREVRLSDFLGKKVALYFYPKDNTPGCSRQAAAFARPSRNLNGWELSSSASARTARPPISGFAEKYQLPFLLLSDPDRQAIQAYDVWQEKSSMARPRWGLCVPATLSTKRGSSKRCGEKAKPDTNAQEMLACLLEKKVSRLSVLRYSAAECRKETSLLRRRQLICSRLTL